MLQEFHRIHLSHRNKRLTGWQKQAQYAVLIMWSEVFSFMQNYQIQYG